MKTVAMISEFAAPLQAGFYIRIENEPWMTLVTEDAQERGPNGLPAISVAHYGPRGDLHKPQLPRYTCTVPVHGNAMREITEADWKVLRRVHPLALERFCERVLAEIDRVSRDGATSHHARYLQIFRILQQRDREMARLFDNPRRSHALTMLAQIRSQGLLTEDEFSSLSPETRGVIQMLLGAG
jgi:hypothetical protein